jgi:hypothetical protein
VATGPNASTSWGAGTLGVVVPDEQGREEGAALEGLVGVPADDAAAGRQQADGHAHGVALAGADQRAHPGGRVARIPIATPASRSRSASSTSAIRCRGTNARRMAVHFWPAFDVISRTTSRTNRSNSRLPLPASRPSTQPFRESASALKRTALRSTAGCARSVSAVAAEPVNDSTSCPSRPSSSPSGSPTSSCRAPSGSSPDSTMRRTASSVT